MRTATVEPANKALIRKCFLTDSHQNRKKKKNTFPRLLGSYSFHTWCVEHLRCCQNYCFQFWYDWVTGSKYVQHCRKLKKEKFDPIFFTSISTIEIDRSIFMSFSSCSVPFRFVSFPNFDVINTLFRLFSTKKKGIPKTIPFLRHLLQTTCCY